MKTVVCISITVVVFLYSSKLIAQKTSPIHIKALTSILKKPVPSGSTLRYEKLIDYLSDSLNATEASFLLSDISLKNSFGKYFYERLSHSTVDKKIIPLLKKIADGQYADLTPSENQTATTKSKTNKPKIKPNPNTESGEIKNTTIDINSGNIFLVKRNPLIVSVPNLEANKNATEEHINNAVFLNKPEGVVFEKKGDYLWQLDTGKGLEGLSNLLNLIKEKEHYFAPNLADDLFVLDSDLLTVFKVNKDLLRVIYAKNFHIEFSTQELIFAITKNNKLPQGIQLKSMGQNHWDLIFTERDFVDKIFDKTQGFDLSEFEEGFAKKIMATSK
jgi:hypothetical protein